MSTTARNVAIMLDDALEDAELDSVRRVESYNMAGVMTDDAGFVMTMDDGTEFQVTVVRSK
jgi:hypothetical protein